MTKILSPSASSDELDKVASLYKHEQQADKMTAKKQVEGDADTS